MANKRCKFCGAVPDDQSGPVAVARRPAEGWKVNDVCPRCVRRVAQDLIDDLSRPTNLILLEEDRRIALMSQVIGQGHPIAFVVEDDSMEPGKANRYFDKLKALHPSLKLVAKEEGPVPQTTLVKVQLSR